MYVATSDCDVFAMRTLFVCDYAGHDASRVTMCKAMCQLIDRIHHTRGRRHDTVRTRLVP